MHEGSTFYLPGSEDDHLWAIISDPDIDAEKVVVVRFLTFHDHDYEQKACVIYPGEHPFIKHATYVDFAGAGMTTAATMQSLEASGALKPKANDIGPALLARIRQAVPNSQIPLEHEKALEDQGLLPR